MSLLTLLDLYTFVQIPVFWCFGGVSNHGTCKKKVGAIVHCSSAPEVGCFGLDWNSCRILSHVTRKVLAQRCSNQQNPICTWYFGSEFKEIKGVSSVDFPTGVKWAETNCSQVVLSQESQKYDLSSLSSSSWQAQTCSHKCDLPPSQTGAFLLHLFHPHHCILVDGKKY